VKFEKDDLSIRQMSIRTDPTNDSSPVIKLNFSKPLNNPKKVIDVLCGLLIIKKGVTGNNITTGPLQYAYWRDCLTGKALRQFSLFSTNVGNETTVNLLTVEQRLVNFFAPRDVLSKQHRYMRYMMRKPYGRSTRQYVGAVNEMNNMLTKLPPGYNDAQKISDPNMIDNLAVLAPREHKNLMIEQGFDPRTTTIETYVEICKRAETKEDAHKETKTRKNARFASDDDESDGSYKKKKKQKKKEYR
jgi:hypothetical protein